MDGRARGLWLLLLLVGVEGSEEQALLLRGQEEVWWQGAASASGSHREGIKRWGVQAGTMRGQSRDVARRREEGDGEGEGRISKQALCRPEARGRGQRA